MTAKASWHPIAKELHALGFEATEIAARLGLHRRTVEKVIFPQEAAPRVRKPAKPKDDGRPRKAIAAAVHRVQRKPAPIEAEPEIVIDVSRKPTLPRISLLVLPEEPAPRVRRFAPRTRLASSGADRIREIHLAMIRAGKIAEPGLLEEIHH